MDDKKARYVQVLHTGAPVSFMSFELRFSLNATVRSGHPRLNWFCPLFSAELPAECRRLRSGEQSKAEEVDALWPEALQLQVKVSRKSKVQLFSSQQVGLSQALLRVLRCRRVLYGLQVQRLSQRSRA